MQVKTWLQRLTDESNLWFNAVKDEDEGNFVAAASGYIEDATRCMEQNLVRAALSCTCAANCLTRLGSTAHAKSLYILAAKTYLQNSEVVMSESIREALWSMQEALENFVLAGDRGEAEIVRGKYVALAARTNPFAPPRDPVPAAGIADRSLGSNLSVDEAKPVEIPRQLIDQIKKLQELRRRPSAPNDPFDPSYVIKAIDSRGGSKLNEKSIAS